MSQNKERMQTLEKEYQAMPHGKARLAAIQGAIREADASGDRAWKLRSRYDAMVEQIFHGDGGKALPLVAEIITLFEEQPIHDLRGRYLYSMYTAVTLWSRLPQLPLDQWEGLMERFQKAAQYYQDYEDKYHEQVFRRGERQGRRDRMERAWKDWNRARHGAACPGCVQRFRLEYAIQCDHAAVPREAAPILDGTAPCDQEPAATLEMLLVHALEQGDREEAERWGGWLRRELSKDSPVMEYDCDLLCWLAYSDPEEGVRMLERAFPDHWQLWDQFDRFEFFNACWVLCRRLAEQGAPALRLTLPREFPLWREDGRYDAGELAEWFYQEARKIAHAFDARDGHPYFAQSLEKAGRYFDWSRE